MEVHAEAQSNYRVLKKVFGGFFIEHGEGLPAGEGESESKEKCHGWRYPGREGVHAGDVVQQ